MADGRVGEQKAESKRRELKGAWRIRPKESEVEWDKEMSQEQGLRIRGSQAKSARCVMTLCQLSWDVGTVTGYTPRQSLPTPTSVLPLLSPLLLLSSSRMSSRRRSFATKHHFFSLLLGYRSDNSCSREPT